MFPIRFDFPFRKANGDMSTIGAEISAGGGGSSYTLPTASAETKGGIKVGTGLSMEGETLVNTNPTPATPYTLPTASADTLGGVKVGDGLSIDENGVMSANGGGGSIPFTDLTKNTFDTQFIDSADKTLMGDALVTFYNSTTGSADYRMISINGNSSYGTLPPKGVLTLILPKGTVINATTWVGKGKDVSCMFSYFN